VVGVVSERCLSLDAGVKARFQTLLEVFIVACQLIIKTDSETTVPYQGDSSIMVTSG